MVSNAVKCLWGKSALLKLQFTGNLGPIHITSEKAKNFYCILMPARADGFFGGDFIKQHAIKVK